MILYAYSEMLEFAGQVLELTLPVGRGTKGPMVTCGFRHGHIYRLSKFEGPFEGPF